MTDEILIKQQRMRDLAQGRPFLAYCTRCGWGQGASTPSMAEHIYELHLLVCRGKQA